MVGWWFAKGAEGTQTEPAIEGVCPMTVADREAMTDLPRDAIERSGAVPGINLGSVTSGLDTA